MKKITRAEATYTGGGIYIYTGQLGSGEYFITSDIWDSGSCVLLMDVDPNENWDDNGEPDWQEAHTLYEIIDDSRADTNVEDFLLEVFDFLAKNNGMSSQDLDRRVDKVNEQRSLAIKSRASHDRALDMAKTIWALCADLEELNLNDVCSFAKNEIEELAEQIHDLFGTSIGYHLEYIADNFSGDLSSWTKFLVDRLVDPVHYEQAYAPNTDTTFIFRDTYKGEDMIKREVVGFYQGEPTKADFELYKNSGSTWSI